MEILELPYTCIFFKKRRIIQKLSTPICSHNFYFTKTPTTLSFLHRKRKQKETMSTEEVVTTSPPKEVEGKLETIEDAAEANKFGFWSAFGFNTMMMFGTGPFISIPYTVASVEPSGSHALVGYSIALVACVCDAFICGELGSMFPYSGGSATYLKHLYGENTFGQFAAFIFLFQFMVAGPAEIASGFIAIAEYLIYFDTEVLGYGARVGISLGALAISTLLLLMSNKEIAWVTVTLAGITIAAVVLSVIVGFSKFETGLLDAPSDAFAGSASTVLKSLAAATRFGVYDMTGYYDVCFMGDEVKNPRKIIPLSCISTAVVIGIVYLIVYISVLGVIDWRVIAPIYSDDSDEDQIGIMSLFYEKTINKGFAQFFTIVVVITIFGSVYSMMAGFQHLLASGAKDGFFFSIFAKRHPKTDIPYVALLTLSALSAAWCFFSLDTVIDAMTTLLVFVQFIGQAVGLLYYRWKTPYEELPEGWRMPLYPLPVIIQIILFFYIFITSPSWVLYGEDPILDICVLFLIGGGIMFLIRAKVKNVWPFADPLLITAQGEEKFVEEDSEPVTVEKEVEHET